MRFSLSSDQFRAREEHEPTLQYKLDVILLSSAGLWLLIALGLYALMH